MGRIEIPVEDFPRSADLVIVGGGIAGTAAAFYAAREGFRTVVLERKPWLGALTTAVACFRAQWDDPNFARLMVPSIATYERFAEEIRVPGYTIGLRQQGWLFATADPAGPERLRQWVERQWRLGIVDTEWWSGEEARRRFPWLSPTVTAATFRARDGWLSPHEVVYGYARASGARFLLETEARRIRTAGGRVVGVETSRGFLATSRVVIAAGPFSKALAATAGVTLPLFLLRRQRAFTPDGRPLIGACPSVDGLYVHTGDNGYGIESAPEAARHLVRLLTGRLSEAENPFRVDRPFIDGGKKVL